MLLKKIIFFISAIVYKIFNSLTKKKFIIANHDIIVLLKKPLGVGDVIMISPLLVYLKNISSTHKLYVVSEYNVFLDIPNIIWLKPQDLTKIQLSNSLLISPTLAFTHAKYLFRAKYFIGYFFSNQLISNFHKTNFHFNPKTEHYFAKIFPILDILNINYSKQELPYPPLKQKKFENYQNYIIVAPYSNWPERQYPFKEYKQLLQNLSIQTQILIIGSSNPKEQIFNQKLVDSIKSSNIINLTGKTSLSEMTYLVKNSKLFIGNDSGPSHIAYSCAVKSLIFFGSVYYETRLPINSILKNKITALDNRSICTKFPCYNGYSKPKCSYQYECLSHIEIPDTFFGSI